MNNRGEAYTENLVGQKSDGTTLKRLQPRKGNKADGDSVNGLEANTEESVVETMVEIVWHCRETRQRTEKTTIDSKSRAIIY